MHISLDVTYMYTNFGGCDFSGVTSPVLEILLLSKMAIYSMVIIKFNCLESAQKKIMQVGVHVTYIHTNFGGRDLSGFGDIATFKNGQFSPSTHGL